MTETTNQLDIAITSVKTGTFQTTYMLVVREYNDEKLRVNDHSKDFLYNILIDYISRLQRRNNRL